MSDIVVRDVTRAGRELGRGVVTGLPAMVSLGALLDSRIRREIASYNERPGPVFVGLVQPADSIRHSDGFRLRRPRPLDADAAIAAAREAVATGMLAFELEGERVTDLDHLLDVDAHAEVLIVLERPVVVAAPSS